MLNYTYKPIIFFMQENDLSRLIDKYLNGECSVEEEREIMNWYNSAGDISPISRLSNREREELKKRMFARIKAKSFAEDEAEKGSPNRNFWLYAAASIVALLIVFFGLRYSPGEVETIASRSAKPVAPSQISFTNTLNKLYKYTLPDNSVVWLKPHASIKFKRAFVNSTREIQLRGEAFFDVTKDPERPFLIHSGQIVTKVLGTSFNIKSSEAETEVAVVTGKVLVYTVAKDKKEESVYLLPQQRVTYKTEKHQLLKEIKKLPAMQIWQKETLTFDNVKISDIVDRLNEEFRSNIVLEDSAIGLYTLKADFTDVNLPTILELLCKSMNKQYRLEGEKIIISN